MNGGFEDRHGLGALGCQPDRAGRQGQHLSRALKPGETALKVLWAIATCTLTQGQDGAAALRHNAVGQKDAKDWKGAKAIPAVCRAQVDGIRAVKSTADNLPAMGSVTPDRRPDMRASILDATFQTMERVGQFRR